MLLPHSCMCVILVRITLLCICVTFSFRRECVFTVFIVYILHILCIPVCRSVLWVGLGWVGVQHVVGWVGLGWVCTLVGWVGLGFKKLTHVHVWSVLCPLFLWALLPDLK